MGIMKTSNDDEYMKDITEVCSDWLLDSMNNRCLSE